MLLAALQGYISRLSAILTANISTDISTEAPYKKILYSTNMAAYWNRFGRPINRSIIIFSWVDILSNKLIDVLKNIAILTVTSPIVIRCQSEVYWLSKQRILLFCGWQNLNIKRLVCKQWVSLYSAKCLWSIGEVSVYHPLYRPL